MLKPLIISLFFVHLSSEQEVFSIKDTLWSKKNDFHSPKIKENTDTWHSFLAADQFMADNSNGCLTQTLCIIAVDLEIDGQIGGGVQQILRSMSAEMRNLPEHKVRRLEHISRLIRAIDRDSVDLCMEFLPCQEEDAQNDQLNEAYHGDQGRFQRTVTNNTCSIAGRVCPSFALTCGFCTHLGFEPCFIICPIVNLVCGPVGVACYTRRKLNEKKAEETNNAANNESSDMSRDKGQIETLQTFMLEQNELNLLEEFEKNEFENNLDEISSLQTSAQSDQPPILATIEDSSLEPTSAMFADLMPSLNAVDSFLLRDDSNKDVL